VPLFVPVETGFSSDIISALQADGHNITVTWLLTAIYPWRVQVQGTFSSSVQAILQDSTGVLYAASDRRKQGAPAGY
jgi:gamma-glutamyltranspeptidase